MPMPYKPLAVANEFIVMAGPSGVSHMKLQKLVYCSYGWWLAYHDEPFISEQPQVWQHGPVFKSLYFALNQFGWRPITSVQNDNFTTPPPRVNDADHEICSMLEWTWGRYGMRSAEWLSDLTHKPGSPWYDTAAEFGFRVPKNTPIPVDRITAHYRDLVHEYGLADA
ncbi:DUF4065 domain-containing protein [Shinella daejeonensis]|uniref:Panacea domain-containing protein n=1 Tax=Shinella daejeonensis TaxID=659017 RepID=UPI0020C77339|nr:type II toxin-antitoxin system antitoxin SocA domain-containing protein [Shinella daejeonensis]MCP8894311.1 DUF4065 domain-containing protein [Shinella daejeonensis]